MKTIYYTIALGSFLLIILSACQSEVKNDAAYERYRESRLKGDDENKDSLILAASINSETIAVHKTRPTHHKSKKTNWFHLQKKKKRS